MNIIQPRIPSGFMELLPGDQIAFNRMMRIIEEGYQRFGYLPIETPAIELSDVLLAKSAGETEAQVYRFMKGDTDQCLRFDLTVPLARYVAEHYNELTFPFRRYAIGKVWRGERAQRGRFREFYQCDVDIIGSRSLLFDAEIPSVIYSVFTALGFQNFTIRINNREILNGFLASAGLAERSAELLRIIDKVDKKGRDAVADDLREAGLSTDQTEKLLRLTTINGSPREAMQELLALDDIDSNLFHVGVASLSAVCDEIRKFGVPEKNFKIDLGIARGLDYYTGTVYETKLDDYPALGSVCGGGRYDNLTRYYSKQDLPGVGISIGLTRLFYQLKEAGLINTDRRSTAQVMVSRAAEVDNTYPFGLATALRDKGVNAEVYLDSAPLSKQLKYANQLGIPYVVIFDPTALYAKDEVILKDMNTGQQQYVRLDAITIASLIT